MRKWTFIENDCQLEITPSLKYKMADSELVMLFVDFVQVGGNNHFIAWEPSLDAWH